MRVKRVTRTMKYTCWSWAPNVPKWSLHGATCWYVCWLVRHWIREHECVVKRPSTSFGSEHPQKMHGSPRLTWPCFLCCDLRERESNGKSHTVAATTCTHRVLECVPGHNLSIHAACNYFGVFCVDRGCKFDRDSESRGRRCNSWLEVLGCRKTQPPIRSIHKHSACCSIAAASVMLMSNANRDE